MVCKRRSKHRRLRVRRCRKEVKTLRRVNKGMASSVKNKGDMLLRDLTNRNN